MFHIVYRLTDQNGNFYFGVHSTKKLKDGYRGSGSWPKECQQKKIKLRKDILYQFETRKEAKEAEEKLIAEHINQAKCMNKCIDANTLSGYRWINNGVDTKLISPTEQIPAGWQTGRLITEYMMETYIERKELYRGENNPYFGKKHSDEIKQKMRVPRRPSEKFSHPKSDTHRKNLSRSIKNQPKKQCHLCQRTMDRFNFSRHVAACEKKHVQT